MGVSYSLDLMSCDSYLFGPFREALGDKRFRADDEIKLFVVRWLEEHFFLKGI
jgi:hypothetical protein